MKSIINFFKNWTLPTAICIGTASYPILSHFYFILPYCIFAMLLLTFCRIPLSEIRFTIMHFWLLFLQIGGSILAFFILNPIHPVLAEGAMVCIIAPVGTAAAVITRKLGGSAASLTSFSLLSNLGTAISVPLIFPWVHSGNEVISFLPAFLTIIKKVFPLLILPFLLAMLLRKTAPSLNQKLGELQDWAFYMWSITLMIVVAKTVNSLISQPISSKTLFLQAITAIIICAIQFFVGKQLGNRYKQRITAGQALGQKNALLAVWMADTYLLPMTSVSAGIQLVCQNLFNAWQLWITQKKENHFPSQGQSSFKWEK